VQAVDETRKRDIAVAPADLDTGRIHAGVAEQLRARIRFEIRIGMVLLLLGRRADAAATAR
jgi:hypothetical protein